MKNLISIILLLLSFSISAQQRFIDSSFQLKNTETKTYATKNGEALKLDIYQPEKDTLQQRPVIIFMHGGGFAGGTRTNSAEVKFAETAAKKGYVAVQISYRLTRKGQSFGCDYKASGKMETFRLAAEDFMDAVHFMVKNKEEYQIDLDKIIVGGSSAGAEAVLNAVYNENLMFDDFSKYENINFAGVFSLAGAIVDARYITEENAVPGVFFHGTEDNLVPYATAPHHWCTPDQPGYIMLDGSKTITEKLENLNTAYMLYSFKDGKHEHSGMPFDYLPEVFEFFYSVFLNEENRQIEVWK
ncbi:alpha/beta hydrolase [Salegentibacter salegens]|uniref:Carboxylesterase family protein n=1 Tax=Salegentibacter salegens TaxID=143223 RepID=A0A1M7IHP7_9FLAO|nr:alpha/beta hydrolase [Salegentibacter salegens]PRX43762.1 carboxylesterase family protein [Salegentibacter salegens]SHM40240.1 Carboxylesterase family protein [Salegentibacter salegens]